ncbi:MAG: single-stranded DNA-binding protein [Vallitaleaceae bacterium]|nr:single-stranded DNA-binding protein [Vallitaleaceae bacterium]
MNKVILMGRLTRDPEVRYSSQGAESMAIAKYSLAVNKRVKREGEPDADFFNIVAFGKQGEFAEKYFKKGQQVAITGRLQTGSYEKDGVKHYTTDVIVDDQFFADSKKSSYDDVGGSQGQAAPKPSYNKPTPTAKPADGFVPINQEFDDDDDLPF